ncbi:MAG: hypothetical protein KDI36_11240 [Pseudomonadales bacterium]|nr:hypothetical protein [Pseudomonadales bacterium]
MIKIGHRGACGYAPENTLKAFELAISMGCSVVELDVHVIQGELLVIHDESLERTTNGLGLLTEHTLEYLRQLDAGEGEQIPTLREVIELIDHRAEINIELKGPDTAVPVNSLLLELCARGWSASEFILSSFNHQELALGEPQFRRGALFHYESEHYFEVTSRLQAWSLNLSLGIVNQQVVDSAHEKGLKVCVYTVNEPEDIQRMRVMGVDAIFTNYPDRL